LRKEIRKDKNTEIPGAVRASIGIYNNEEEVDIFLDTVENIATGKIKQDQLLKV
jgi:selenocysteine lyase/cysteine desulfurase